MELREPIVAYGKKTFTIAEYLEMEAASVEKNEYYQGEIFAMSGALLPHNIIAVNILGYLHQKLKGKSCRPFNSDMRIHVKENTLFTYHLHLELLYTYLHLQQSMQYSFQLKQHLICARS
jgi:Uma2 family endonuclease